LSHLPPACRGPCGRRLTSPRAIAAAGHDGGLPRGGHVRAQVLHHPVVHQVSELVRSRVRMEAAITGALCAGAPPLFARACRRRAGVCFLRACGRLCMCEEWRVLQARGLALLRRPLRRMHAREGRTVLCRGLLGFWTAFTREFSDRESMPTGRVPPRPMRACTRLRSQDEEQSFREKRSARWKAAMVGRSRCETCTSYFHACRHSTGAHHPTSLRLPKARLRAAARPPPGPTRCAPSPSYGGA